MDPLLGAVVSHYRVLEQIGAGGMGVVYLAEDERLHRKVALKFIAPSSAGDTVARRRLLREAQAASALDHPNIAIVYEVGDFQDQLFIAMAYYQGQTLKHRIEHGPLSMGEAASIAGHIAEGLEAAHAAGVVHRDLKPANVFLTSSGQVKILDFGLAKVEAATTDTTVEGDRDGHDARDAVVYGAGAGPWRARRSASGRVGPWCAALRDVHRSVTVPR